MSLVSVSLLQLQRRRFNVAREKAGNLKWAWRHIEFKPNKFGPDLLEQFIRPNKSVLIGSSPPSGGFSELRKSIGMADYHFVYKDVEGASTQWDDIQRKLGNLPPKPAPSKPPPFTPAEDKDSKQKDKGWIDEKTEEELEDLEDDLDDDRFLEEYRKMRLAEMRKAAKVAKFGSVIPISGSDFVREVSQAPQDVWVVVLLYKEGNANCGPLLQCLEDLAKRYPGTKFVKIISTECIPNYPDINLPTILVYNNSAVKATYAGMQSFGRRCTPESVAVLLCQSDPVLNDGHGGEQSREEVLEGVRKQFLERVVREREDNDDGSASD